MEWFGNALADTNMPDNAVLLAVVGFNVGVEIGQLIVVALTLVCPVAAAITAACPIPRSPSGWCRLGAHRHGPVPP